MLHIGHLWVADLAAPPSLSKLRYNLQVEGNISAYGLVRRAVRMIWRLKKKCYYEKRSESIVYCPEGC
jgi:hypothetical protein